MSTINTKSGSPIVNTGASSVDSSAGTSSIPDDGGAPPATSGSVTGPVKKPASGWAKVAAKAKDGVLTLASSPISVASANVKLGSNLANLHFHGNFTEKVALKHSDPLVQSNPDRAASEGITWTKVGMVADGGAELLGLGYDRGVKISGVVPTDSKVSLKSLGKLPIDQFKVMTVDLHPNNLLAYPAGTEFHIQAHRTTSAGAVLGSEASFMQAHAGAEIGAEIKHDKAAYSKTVVVMPNKHLGVGIDKHTSWGASAGAGVGVGYGIVDHDRHPNIGDFRNEPNHANILSMHIGTGASRRSEIELYGNFAGGTDPGIAGYDYVMKADPNKISAKPKDAKAELERLGMTVGYQHTDVAHGSDVSAAVLGKELINVGTQTTKTKGTLYEVVPGTDGKVIDETTLNEDSYSKSLAGKLIGWAKGQERKSVIRMTEIARKGGPPEEALSMWLNVKDHKVSDAENHEAVNFASGFGYKANQPATGVNGPGELTVRLALTNDSVKKLDSMSKADFMASINRSMETVAGHPLPWNDDTVGKKSTAYWNEKFKEPLTVKARWAEAQNDLANRDTNGMDEMKIKQQYESSTGRNYYQDLSTFHSIEAISNAFDKAKGKPLAGRTDFLKTLSRMSAPDLRATLMALHRDADARVVDFEYVGNGVSIKPASEGPDVPTVRDIVNAAKVRADGADPAQAPQVE